MNYVVGKKKVEVDHMKHFSKMNSFLFTHHNIYQCEQLNASELNCSLKKTNDSLMIIYT